MAKRDNIMHLAIALILFGLIGIILAAIAIKYSIFSSIVSFGKSIDVFLTIGLVLSFIGLFLGVLSKKKSPKSKTNIGFTASLIGLVLFACPLTQLSNTIIDSFRRLISGIHF